MGIFTNNGGADQALETIRAEIETKDREIADLKQQLALLDEQIAKLKATNPTATEAPAETPQAATEEQGEATAEATTETPKCDVTFPDYAPSFEALMALLNELKAQNEALKEKVGYCEANDERLRDIVKELHKEMASNKIDISKLTKPYLSAMMDLHYRFYGTFAHFDTLDNSEQDFAKLYGDLMREFKNAITAISDRIYNDFGYEYYEPQVGDEFNPKEQQAMSVVETEDESLARRIAQVMYGGYRDEESGKIIRQARIACYRYVAPVEATPAPEAEAEAAVIKE